MCNMDSSTPYSSESAPCEPYQQKKSTDVSSSVQNFDSIYVADQYSEEYLSWEIPPDCDHLSSVVKYCSEFHSTAFSFNFPQVYSQETHETYYSTAIMPPTLMWPYWYHFQHAYYQDVTENSFSPFFHVSCQGELDNYLHFGDLQCTYSSPVIDSSRHKAMKFKTKCSKLQELSESSQGHIVAGGKVASSRIFSSLTLRKELIIRGADTRSSLMLRNIPSRYKQDKLLAELTEEGFGSDMIDFLYLPINPKNNRNRGYAFVNFVDYKNIIPFYKHFGGRPWKLFNEDTKKSCEVSYSVIQGKAAMLKNFEHSLCFEQKVMYHPVTFVSDGPNKGDIEVIFTS